MQNLEILSSLELYKVSDESYDEPCFIMFPDVFKYCQEQVLNDLETVLIQSREHDWTYKERIVKEEFFQARVFHRQVFLDTTHHIVKHRNMIKVSDDFKDYLVGKLDDPAFFSLGNDIKSLLLGQKLIRFEAGDRINNETFFRTICKKLNMDEVKCEMIQILFKDLFEETIEIVTHVSESLGQSIIEKLKGTELDESFP
ncbi:unnamed protein product, partial [Rotaria magnacalcarata]